MGSSPGFRQQQQPFSLTLCQLSQIGIGPGVFQCLIDGNNRLIIFLLVVLGQREMVPDIRIGRSWIQDGCGFQLFLRAGIVC